VTSFEEHAQDGRDIKRALCAPSDSLKEQLEKCVRWMEAVVKEVFLVHPQTTSVYVYTDAGVEEISEATSVSSRHLAGFKLECSMIWEDL
jgi:hypothetical protein